jgi:uncharacterized protein YjbJ (UPF0337 family)
MGMMDKVSHSLQGLRDKGKQGVDSARGSKRLGTDGRSDQVKAAIKDVATHVKDAATQMKDAHKNG